MGFLSTVLSLAGFVWGIGIGLVLGYFFFIYHLPIDVKDPIIRPLMELDSNTLHALLSEIPLWVKNPDYDRVDWLNKFTAALWPYLDKAICKIILNTAQPYIDQYGSKFKLEALEFDSLTLGSLPPTIVGVKVFDTQEHEMIIEPSIKWAGNPNIILAAKAYGVKGTMQMVDVQVFATIRITLKPLVPVFPCFSKIIISLMEKPHVDFGFKLLGGDLMAIPGLSGFVQDLIKERVAKMYLWPKTLEISVTDGATAERKPVGMLIVKVVKGSNLMKKDFMGKSDPYVTLQLGEGNFHKKRTTVKLHTLNPEWNETFHMVVQDPEFQALELHVFDWDKVGPPDKLGMQVIPLKTLMPEESKILTLDLVKNMDANDPANRKFRGKLTVELTYRVFKDDDSISDVNEGQHSVGREPEKSIEETSSGGLLFVAIHEGEDLEGKHHTNPYAKVVFKGETRKTKVIKKNRDPRWEAEFEFTCEEPPVNDRLHVEVLSRITGFHLHSRESLGHCDINLADVVHNKRINEKYQLVDSKNGKLLVEMRWRPD
ncbi:hypothetical protein O6H91_21G048700 [Diphasiastrum complanatum]|uniref:Uncharacterized protein n=2 Tax=Diphasiastrum complanatum TaxID=34168 RepID=A0ACC2ALI4_DIPCM|nr:hypothetical protein O6H91_21G048700 [Diphasiastrum complanatum]KAJ7517983.1 hypothetical protein O6H91_21G048700 [Diphasiastrum complanatum]